MKFKRMEDKDFVICGYEVGDMTSLIREYGMMWLWETENVIIERKQD